jgi:hypothetical protein
MKEIDMAKKDEIQTENKVEVMIPRTRGNNEANYFVGVNGVNYVLPRGKKSLVPDFVAEEIERSRAAEEAMYEAQDELKAKE